MEVRPRKSDFRENRISSLNNVKLNQDFNPFYATGLFLTPCGFFMFSEGIERDKSHDVG